MNTLQERMRAARRKCGWSQAQLAEKAGLNQSAIAHIESGRNDSSRHLAVIAKVLGVRAEWLATGEGEPMSNWPFPGISPTEYESLTPEDKEDLLTLLKGKLQRRGKKIEAA